MDDDYYHEYRIDDAYITSYTTIESSKVATASDVPTTTLKPQQNRPATVATTASLSENDIQSRPSAIASHDAHTNEEPPTAATDDNDDKMYRCRCGRNYTLLRNYNYHSRWECGRVHSCSKCGKTYKDSSSYRKHCKVSNCKVT